MKAATDHRLQVLCTCKQLQSTRCEMFHCGPAEEVLLLIQTAVKGVPYPFGQASL